MKPLVPLLAAAALLAPGLASAALEAPHQTWAIDMSGLWILSSSQSGTPLTIDCNVLQIGAQLFGSCQPATQNAVPTALFGQIVGSNANWAYDVNDQGRTLHVQYQANVLTNASLNGTLTWAGVPSGFTAVRK